MGTKPLTHRQRYWLEHLSAAAKTDGSLVNYAKTHQLAVAQLYVWKSRLTTLGHWPVTSPANESGFVRVAAVCVSSPATTVNVLLPNGLRLELQVTLDRHLLRELMAAGVDT